MFIWLNSRKGFTLVEIMIVVAIIGLLAAIAIPNLLRARVNANEGASKGALRTLSTALESYRAAQNPPAYPTTAQGLAQLGAAVSNPPYIDNLLAGGNKQGYNFAYVSGATTSYSVTGTPVTPNVTGVNTFFVDNSGVIRFTNAAGNPVEG